jgi:hypothetical protein
LIDPAVDLPAPYPIWIQRDILDKFETKKFPKTVWKMDGLKLYECPLSWITQDTMILMEYLFLEENPIDLFPGGRTRQPKWWLEAIKTLKNERANNIKRT